MSNEKPSVGLVHTHLCVGGPLDGQRYDSHEESGFNVPVQSYATTAIENQTSRLPPSAMMKDMRYETCVLRTPDGDVGFYVPAGTRTMELVHMLTAGYRVNRATTRAERHFRYQELKREFGA